MIKLVENERKQLLNGLSDAIKECQLRFGGKRELATDLDSRVCVLCLKLEAIFMHGLKKKPMLLNSSSSQSSSSSSSSSSILAGTLQFNSIISLKNKTGNLISQLFDENKPTTNSFLQSNSQNNTQIDDISFWPFVKNLMNKFDIERYELLNNIKTNTGRQRAWLRSCLNEHCLERFTIAVLANETLTNQFYEEWSFLLDKSYNSTLPMLISGLESILFAINIDNPSLNIPSKLVLANNIKAINETINNENNNNNNKTNDDNLVETIAIKIKKPLNNNSLVQNTNLNRKIRKNNVVVLDSEIDSIKTSDETTSANTSPEKKPIRSRSVFSTSSYSSLTSSMPNRSSILVNPINYSPKKDLEQNDLDNDLMKKNEEEKKDLNSDLNLFEIGSLRNEVFDKIIIEKSTSTTSLKDHSKSNEINDISTDSSTEADIYNANLIPVNATINNGSTTVDNISINSYLSEHSNEINFNSYKANNTNLNVNGSYNNNISPSSLTSSKSMEMNQNIPQISNSSQRTSTIIASEYDGLNLKEMREFVLTMIQRKDDLENKYKKLDENYKEELQKSKDLNDKLIQIEQETKIKTDNYENKIQNLESENKLLKDQLKKYVSAVQMIRSNTVCSTSDTSVSGNQIASTIPAVNPNLQRDYSFEAEQYEKKLIQVAEMHGELMEFNSRLHKILNFKTLQIEKLKQELIELRGPLPNEMMLNETYDESFSMMSDIESLTNLNGPLINIWIPSAFLRTNKSDSHHVYQIYVRIRDEEWNIYRRFSHFFNLNVRLKEKFPALKTIKFPKKKAIGNKDSKFVENRRKMLQDYLRQIVTTVSQVDRDLSLKPCRETLSKTIPFLSDQHFFTASNNSEMMNPSNIQNFTNPTFGNSLGHIVRNNTFLEANEILSNSPVLNAINTNANNSNNNNEPVYTGL